MVDKTVIHDHLFFPDRTVDVFQPNEPRAFKNYLDYFAILSSHQSLQFFAQFHIQMHHYLTIFL